MEEAGLEAMVCVQPINVYYASGYESDWLFDYQWAGCAILPLSEHRPATLIVHDVELTNLAEHPSWMPELRVYETQVGDDLFCHYTVDEEAELEESDRKTLALMDATRATASVAWWRRSSRRWARAATAGSASTTRAWPRCAPNAWTAFSASTGPN